MARRLLRGRRAVMILVERNLRAALRCDPEASRLQGRGIGITIFSARSSVIAREVAIALRRGPWAFEPARELDRRGLFPGGAVEAGEEGRGDAEALGGEAGDGERDR